MVDSELKNATVCGVGKTNWLEHWRGEASAERCCAGIGADSIGSYASEARLPARKVACT
jgi:hypothetical protein